MKEKRLILALSLLLVTSPSWACDSFDNCMERGNKLLADTYSTPIDGKMALMAAAQVRFTEAIAYKLDEISKKLDIPETTKERIYRTQEPSFEVRA